ncbi:hypothetical protein MLD38_018666 [Melastoma candidum]|uniref:Uncharacterized protein n=1 Tax=Melastoma candidum TaxID=119954 RepID=A0ACB9QUJ6_9MYRT|nr:hypothetical protein MLD38_018666 [Melastoma candidum]
MPRRLRHLPLPSCSCFPEATATHQLNSLASRHHYHSMHLCFCSSGSGASLRENTGKLLGEDVLSEVASVKDADEALRIISSRRLGGAGGVLGVSECCDVIRAAFLRGVMEDGVGSPIVGWRWSRPDVRVYTMLIPGLASVLRISDALNVLNYICQMGVSSTEEIPFGKVVNCPTCMIAVAVAQPQDGSQIASCAKCRYKYEFISGDIITIGSEEIRYSSMEMRTEILELDESNDSCRSQFCLGIVGVTWTFDAVNGSDPFWCCMDSSICHRNRDTACSSRREGDNGLSCSIRRILASRPFQI